MPKPFLAAEWRNLVMANYEVDPKILQPYLPAKTELDLWEGKCLVSLVGFLFSHTRVLGVKFPGHINFEEVNLRFYVRHFDGVEWKRGVVFIKEIVPRKAITFFANTLYREHYITCPMNHLWENHKDHKRVKYSWKHDGRWNHIEVKTSLDSIEIPGGSEEEFITEHYWGYTKIGAKKTSEYQVTHPRWNVHRVMDYNIQFEAGQLYGPEFDDLQNRKPDSVFMADGSEIEVLKGSQI